MNTRAFTAAWFMSIALLDGGARAQSAACPDWAGAFAAPGPSASVRASATFDDGGGPALFVGGSFTSIGSTPVARIARRRNQTWTQVGDGFDGTVRALIFFDDGSGPALYAGGDFTHSGAAPVKSVAKWTGGAWVQVGTGLLAPVATLCVYGNSLYAGGEGIVPTLSGLARLSGGAWSAPAGGVLGRVAALAVFDPGTGPRLYATGVFGAAGIGGGVVAANSIVSFDGSGYAPLGAGLVGTLPNPPFGMALASFDDGSGPALFVGGIFSNGGGFTESNFLKWTGAAWASPPPIPTGPGVPYVSALRVLDDGGGAALYAGYDALFLPDPFDVGTVARLAHGSASFTKLGADFDGSIATLAAFDDGGGISIWAGGGFGGVGALGVANLARWKSGAWSVSATGGGIGGLFVRTAIEFDDGNGPRLYVGGRFEHAGAVAAKNVARFDGTSWSAIGAGLNSDVWALCVFDDGTGEHLYAAGTFTASSLVAVPYVAMWTGTQWKPVGAGTDGPVLSLTTFDDGSGDALYAGGQFTMAGSSAATGVARWKSGAWSAVGAGPITTVYSLCAFDAGTGPRLHAAGVNSSPSLAGRVARLSGGAWSFIGSFDGAVETLAVHDSGAGPELYAGGQFTKVGANARAHVAKWLASSTWLAVGAGVDGTDDWVHCLASFDDGGGPALFAIGDFDHAGGQPASRVARWRCGAWSGVGGGTDGGGIVARGIQSAVLGGPALVIGGTMTTAGAAPSALVAQWHGCAPALATFGSGCTGTGGFVPRLAVTGCPHGSGTIALKIDRGLGGSSALLFLGLGAASTPVGGGCTFLVSQLFPVAPTFTLSGSGAGAGGIAIPATLPPSVPVLKVFLQAFVIDPANPIGGAGTNGAWMALE